MAGDLAHANRARPPRLSPDPAREAAAPAERVQRRDLPGTQAIRIKADNPKRGGTLAHARYELYKSSTTIGEARAAGMTPQDLHDEIARAKIELL